MRRVAASSMIVFVLRPTRAAAPLRPGQHTITFGGTGNFNGPFIQDITYHLLVTW